MVGSQQSTINNVHNLVCTKKLLLNNYCMYVYMYLNTCVHTYYVLLYYAVL